MKYNFVAKYKFQGLANQQHLEESYQFEVNSYKQSLPYFIYFDIKYLGYGAKLPDFFCFGSVHSNDSGYGGPEDEDCISDISCFIGVVDFICTRNSRDRDRSGCCFSDFFASNPI